MQLTAQQIYDKLIDDYQIKTLKGQIRFHLGDVDIIVKQKDVIGNIIQEWVEGWLEKQKIEHEPNPNTQMPPDFYLCPDNHKTGLLEIKAFNFKSSPAFDIADFKSFVNELIEKPYHLETDFLIFAYIMDTKSGDIIIKDVWLKKIWEISRPMENWAINVQYKNNTVQKMRPGVWYSNNQKFPMFKSMTDYLAAFEDMVYQCAETRLQADQWRNRFRRSYLNHYDENIDFPKWPDIKRNYGVM